MRVGGMVENPRGEWASVIEHAGSASDRSHGMGRPTRVIAKVQQLGMPLGYGCS